MVSFGLVTIPIKLYSTGESAAGIQLNMLHRKCGSRLKQQYVCPVDDVVVGRDEMVKGYEYAKGQYVLFTEDEIKALNREATNAIEITEFVPLAQVDPIYFEKSYYLGPDKGGERPYRLLAEAMKQTERAALARYAARGKDYLVLLRPFEEGLILQQLRYYDELRPFSEVPIGDAEVREPELKLARQIIDQIANDRFEPTAYEDEVRQQTMALIEKKVAGQEISAVPVEAPKAQIIDLMAALKASLAAAPQPESAPGRPRSAAARTAKPAAVAAAAAAPTGPAAAPPAPARSEAAAAPRRPVRTARAAAARPAKSVRAAVEPAAPLPEPVAPALAPSLSSTAQRKPPKRSPRTSLRATPAAAPALPRRKSSKR
jgi:DNA end-binding protein Ku